MNVGERNDADRQRQREPARIAELFPGESAWGDYFCGGHRDDVDDPGARADYLISVITNSETICGGGLGTKWWPKTNDN
jgi:hypothetical protein